MRYRTAFYIQILKLLSHHKLCSYTCHGYAAHFAHKRHCPAGAGIGFQNINHIVAYCVLYVHKTNYIQLDRDFAGVLDNSFNVFGRDSYWRNNTGRVTRMYPCFLNMLHNRWNKCISSVSNSIGLSLNGIFKELVYQYWSFR